MEGLDEMFSDLKVQFLGGVIKRETVLNEK